MTVPTNTSNGAIDVFLGKLVERLFKTFETKVGIPLNDEHLNAMERHVQTNLAGRRYGRLLAQQLCQWGQDPPYRSGDLTPAEWKALKLLVRQGARKRSAPSPSPNSRKTKNRLKILGAALEIVKQPAYRRPLNVNKLYPQVASKTGLSISTIRRILEPTSKEFSKKYRLEVRQSRSEVSAKLLSRPK